LAIALASYLINPVIGQLAEKIGLLAGTIFVVVGYLDSEAR